MFKVNNKGTKTKTDVVLQVNAGRVIGNENVYKNK